MDHQLKRIREGIDNLDTLCAFIESEGLASSEGTETVEHHIDLYYSTLDKKWDAMNMLKRDFGSLTLAEANRLYLDEYNEDTRIKEEEETE